MANTAGHFHALISCYNQHRRPIACSNWLLWQTLQAVVGAADLNELRLIWQQMLTAVNVIHEARIVHGDLKPASYAPF